MSANINTNVLKTFILDKLGSNKVDLNQAKDLGVDKKDFKEADVDNNEYLDLDEILDSDDIVAMFTAQYKEEVLSDNEPDKEKENAVSGAQGRGNA